MSHSATVKKYHDRLVRLVRDHHGECVFRNNPPIEDLRSDFRPDGTLVGRFTCGSRHQGFRDRAHGGLMAAVVDASMAQCLMGHGIVAYTADLSLRYRGPVHLGVQATVETRIVEEALGMLYRLECRIRQGRETRVVGKGRFYRFGHEQSVR